VVINLGTNDFSSEETSGTALDDLRFKEAYRGFIQTVRGNYPHAKIVCTVGPMMSDDWPEGKKAWTRIRKIVSGLVQDLKDHGDPDIHFLELASQTEPYGEDWHPTTARHQIMADTLLPLIRNITGWH
jgi:hypothetical protein